MLSKMQLVPLHAGDLGTVVAVDGDGGVRVVFGVGAGIKGSGGGGGMVRLYKLNAVYP